MVYQRGKTLQGEPAQQKLYNQARQFSGRPSTVTTTLPETVSQDCSAFYEQIETLPMESLLFDLKEGKLSIPSHCEQDSHTAKLFSDLKADCAFLALQETQGKCESSLFHFRARRIQLWSDGQSLDELSTEILVQRFFGLLSSGTFAEVNGSNEFRQIGQILRKRLPNSNAPIRIELVGYLTSNQLTDQERADFQNLIREARERSPDDWQLFEMDLMQKALTDESAYQKAVQDFLAASPESPIGLYHAGCVAWKNGQKAEATAYFQQTLQKSPEDPRFKETFQKSQSSDLGESICTASLSFNSQDF